MKEAGTFDQKRKITKESNDTFDAPQTIEINTIIQGVARKEDADYYRFQGKKGQQVTIEVFGMRLGRKMFDPYLALLDSDRFELAPATTPSSPNATPSFLSFSPEMATTPFLSANLLTEEETQRLLVATLRVPPPHLRPSSPRQAGTKTRTHL